MSNILYQKEWSEDFKKTIDVPYCGKCFTPLSLLGIKDRQTKETRFICTKCGKILTDNSKELK